MTDVFGRPIDEVRTRVGAWHQVVRVDRFLETDGPASGARRVRLVNGGGLEIDVHPDRGLDIGQVTCDGVPVAWMSPVGLTSPHAYEPAGNGWLRTFSGGLLATCGLDAFGPPSRVGGTEFGLHGRIGTTPATVTGASVNADEVVVTGEVRQTSVFGEHLVLRRRISTAIGSDEFIIVDRVTNEGFEPAPHMVLYHVNLGWPLLDEDSTITIPSTSARPRDDDASVGFDHRLEWPAPIPGFAEQVFHHRFDGATEDPWVRVVNPRLGLDFAMSFGLETLPYLVQWKMSGEGHYVLGVEPTNADTLAGRADAESSGAVAMLAPGQSVQHHLTFRLRRHRPLTDQE